MTYRLAITPGEPAGIGPDIVIQQAQMAANVERVVIGDSELLQARADQLQLPLNMQTLDLSRPPEASKAGTISVSEVKLAVDCIPGTLNVDNAHYVLATLDRAIDMAQQKTVSGLVTGPIQKSIINQAGIAFSGHTEYLAKATDTPLVVMMLATHSLRVALVTTHLPLSAVPKAITAEHLKATLVILHNDLVNTFGISQPRILVCGLNPHAGEDGHLGREEITTITPVIESLKATMNLQGPLPADTLFTPRYLETADAVLAMYHDQGLPVLKSQGFGEAVNITLGLPFTRTSVDHGTALSLAGSSQASHSSLNAAIDYADFLVSRNK